MWGPALTQAPPQDAQCVKPVSSQSTLWLHVSPWLWGGVVGQPPALHRNLRDGGGGGHQEL